MSKRPGVTESEHAFTLIELLVSVIVISISMLAIYETFATGLSAWRRGEDDMAIYQTARIGLNTMTRELRSAILFPKGREDKEELPQFEGESDKVTFYTLRSPNPELFSRKTGLLKVTYELKGEAEGQKSLALIRKKQPAAGAFLLAEPTEEEIFSNVGGLELRYFDGREWRESWKSNKALPKMVKITLTLVSEEEKREVTFPAIVDVAAGP